MTTTVTATYLSPSGNPCSGRVIFRLVAASYHDGLDAIFPTVPQAAVLDTNGEIAVELEPTDAFDTTAMTYQVWERINDTERSPYYVDVPDTASIDLGVLTTYDTPPFSVRELVIPDLSSLGYLLEEDAHDTYIPLTDATVIADYTCVGDGNADDSDALQAAIDSLTGPGTVLLGAGKIYGVTEPIVLSAHQTLASYGKGGRTVGATIKALSGFTGDAVVMNDSVTLGDWFHRGTIRAIDVDCNDQAAVGIWIHQMGEESLIERCAVYNATDTAYRFTGTHAVGRVRDCSGWVDTTGAYAFEWTVNPYRPADANGGVFLVDGISGDNGTSGDIGDAEAFIHVNGTQSLTLAGLKVELFYTTILIDGTSQVVMSVSGDSRSPAPAEGQFLQINGTATPVIHCHGLRVQQFLNLVDDAVRGTVYAAPPNQARISTLDYVPASNTAVTYTYGTPVFQSSDHDVPALRLRRMDSDTGGDLFVLEDENQNILFRVGSDGVMQIDGNLDGNVRFFPHATAPGFQWRHADVATSQVVASSGGTINVDSPGAFLVRTAIGGGSEMLRLHPTNGAVLSPTGGRVGFMGATPVVRPTVTGSRGSNAALASLITALANLGLVTDSSS